MIVDKFTDWLQTTRFWVHLPAFSPESLGIFSDFSSQFLNLITQLNKRFGLFWVPVDNEATNAHCWDYVGVVRPYLSLFLFRCSQWTPLFQCSSLQLLKKKQWYLENVSSSNSEICFPLVRTRSVPILLMIRGFGLEPVSFGQSHSHSFWDENGQNLT